MLRLVLGAHRDLLLSAADAFQRLALLVTVGTALHAQLWLVRLVTQQDFQAVRQQAIR